MRKYKVKKWQQQGLYVPNPDSMKPRKLFIPYKYNNRMELQKTKKIKYFTNALLELRYQGFSEGEVIICANSTDALEKIIVWYKEMPTYIEGDAVYI